MKSPLEVQCGTMRNLYVVNSEVEFYPYEAGRYWRPDPKLKEVNRKALLIWITLLGQTFLQGPVLSFLKKGIFSFYSGTKITEHVLKCSAHWMHWQVLLALLQTLDIRAPKPSGWSLSSSEPQPFSLGASVGTELLWKSGSECTWPQQVWNPPPLRVILANPLLLS